MSYQTETRPAFLFISNNNNNYYNVCVSVWNKNSDASKLSTLSAAVPVVLTGGQQSHSKILPLVSTVE